MSDILYIIDLDRTLINVNEVMELAEAVCDKLGIDFSSIKLADDHSKKTGWSYSPLKAIEEAGVDQGAFKREFVANAASCELFYPDGKELLAKLDELKEQYMILTHAIDSNWQKLKLEATGLDKVPHYITLNPLKGEDITGWMGKDGIINPPVAGISPVKTAWLIDDRQRAFVGLPSSCRGFHLIRFEAETKLQTPQAPNVSTIHDLTELIDKI